VLARQGAAELQHQVCDFIRNCLECRGVGIDAGHRVMPLDNLHEAANVVAQFLRRHRGVFNERDRLAVGFHRRRQAEGGLAEAPDAGLRRNVDDLAAPAVKACALQVVFDGIEARQQIVGVFAVELHTQQG
jgi:hypothetical protein